MYHSGVCILYYTHGGGEPAAATRPHEPHEPRVVAERVIQQWTFDHNVDTHNTNDTTDIYYRCLTCTMYGNDNDTKANNVYHDIM